LRWLFLFALCDSPLGVRDTPLGECGEIICEGEAMKTIGLIGGMSWESSAEYYRLINEAVKRRLGGLHSARSLMLSVDFAEIEGLQRGGRWEEAAQQLVDAARRLERGGADFLVLCTNTMHRVADGGRRG
jgi:aspartate racemase